MNLKEGFQKGANKRAPFVRGLFIYLFRRDAATQHYTTLMYLWSHNTSYHFDIL